MAGEAQDEIWPLPKFYFTVNFGIQDGTVSFQEVSGLDSETKPIEYKHGDNNLFSTVKMPGIAKSGNVTLKKGIFVNDNNFWKWYDAIKMNTVKRETVVIQLLDESAKPTMTWTLSNAWPTKITGTDMKSDTNNVVIETIELAHEGLTIVNRG